MFAEPLSNIVTRNSVPYKDDTDHLPWDTGLLAWLGPPEMGRVEVTGLKASRGGSSRTKDIEGRGVMHSN